MRSPLHEIDTAKRRLAGILEAGALGIFASRERSCRGTSSGSHHVTISLIAGPPKLRASSAPLLRPTTTASTMADLADITGAMGELMLKGWVRTITILDFLFA